MYCSGHIAMPKRLGPNSHTPHIHIKPQTAPLLAAKDKGYIKATVTPTDCKGLINPCSSMPPKISNSFYNISSKFADVEDQVDLDFSCNKSQCCVVQQFPVFKVVVREGVTHVFNIVEVVVMSIKGSFRFENVRACATTMHNGREEGVNI